MRTQTFLLLTFTVFFALKLDAQKKYNISLNGGLYTYGSLIAKVEDAQIKDHYSALSKNNQHINVNVSFYLKRRLLLGFEAGYNHLNWDLSLEQIEANGRNTRYRGDYRVRQCYAFVVPEYRFGKFMFVNIGVGLAYELRSEFSQGTSYTTYPGYFSYDLAGQSYQRDSFFGNFMNVGVCPSFNQHLAARISLRVANNPVIAVPDRLQIGFWSVSVQAGVEYRFH